MQQPDEESPNVRKKSASSITKKKDTVRPRKGRHPQKATPIADEWPLFQVLWNQSRHDPSPDIEVIGKFVQHFRQTEQDEHNVYLIQCIILAFALKSGEKPNPQGVVYQCGVDRKTNVMVVQLQKLPPKLLHMLMILQRFEIHPNPDEVDSTVSIGEYRPSAWDTFNTFNRLSDVISPDCLTTSEQLQTWSLEKQSLAVDIVLMFGLLYNWDAMDIFIGEKIELKLDQLPMRLRRILRILDNFDVDVSSPVE